MGPTRTPRGDFSTLLRDYFGALGGLSNGVSNMVRSTVGFVCSPKHKSALGGLCGGNGRSGRALRGKWAILGVLLAERREARAPRSQKPIHKPPREVFFTETPE